MVRTFAFSFYVKLHQKNVVYTNCENSIEYSDRYDIGENGLLSYVKNAAFHFPMLILAEAVILSQRINI
jgi:hypothetical protein